LNIDLAQIDDITGKEREEIKEVLGLYRSRSSHDDNCSQIIDN